MTLPQDRKVTTVSVQCRIEGQYAYLSSRVSYQDENWGPHDLQPIVVRVSVPETLDLGDALELAARMCAYTKARKRLTGYVPKGLAWREMPAGGGAPAPPQGATGVVLKDDGDSVRTGDVINEEVNTINTPPSEEGAQRVAKRRTSSRSKA